MLAWCDYYSKESFKSKYAYSGYVIALEDAGSWNFGNDLARNVVIFGLVIFKTGNRNVNFPTQFCLGSISNKFDALDSREIFLRVNVHDFSIDYNAINKCNMLKIHKYLMVKHNIN